MRRRALWLAAVISSLSMTAPARADAPLPKIEWDPAWAKVRPWEYVAGPAMVTGAMILRFAGPTPGPTWSGGILFDDAVIDAVAVRGHGARSAVILMSDIGFFGAMGYRAIDSILLPGLLHG